MGNKLFSKFNTYDQIGYLLVGSIALLLIYSDALLLNYTLPKLDLGSAVIWLIVAYFLGHIIQAVANVFIKEKKADFNQQEKSILNTAKKFFNTEEISDHETWNLCYMAALAKDATGQISSFNAYYSLYRGWLMLFIFQSVFLLIHLVFFFHLLSTLWLIISVLLALLFYRRSKRFYTYLRTKVLQTFLLIKALEL